MKPKIKEIMKRETKHDILVMLYQFVVGGVFFWICVYSNFQPNVLGNVISPLDMGVELPLWRLLTSALLVVGIVSFYLQRRYMKNANRTA